MNAPAVAAPDSPSLNAWAQTFPDPARVNADIAAEGQGDDPLIVGARQRGALYQLYNALSRMSGSLINDPDDKLLAGRKPPRSVTAKRQAYWAAIMANQSRWYPQIEQQKSAPCDGKPRRLCKRARYMDTSGALQYSEDYAKKVAQRYFPPAMRVEYVLATRSPHLPPQPAPFQPVAPQEDNVIGTLILFGLGGLALLILYSLIRRRRLGEPEDRRVSDNYGSASWAHPRTTLDPETPFETGVFLGKSGHDMLAHDEPIALLTAPIFTGPEAHTLIVARSGAGKGTSVVVPTLLRLRESVFVIDPKGENAAITARARRDQLGQQVHILNPWNELEADFNKLGFTAFDTYNPLDVLQPKDPNLEANAAAIAAAICGTPEGETGIWRGSAADMVIGVLLWLTDQPGEEKTLGRLRHIVTRPKSELFAKYFVPMAASKGCGGSISERIGPFLELPADTFGSVLFNATTHTSFISDSGVRQATAKSSFSMDQLIQGRTSVYVIIPTDRIATGGAWLRLLIFAATYRLRRTARNDQSPRCLMLLDEFANIGRLDNFPKLIGEMRGYGINYALIVQTLSQLRATYGEADADTIRSNCQYQWFCNIQDLPTAKYLSEALGKKTIATTTTSSSSGESGDSSSTSYGEMGRDLLTPDEILNLDRGRAILLPPKGRPNYLFTISYGMITKAFAHLAPGEMRAYFEPPLRYDDNPYHRQKQQDKKASGQKAGQGSREKGQGSQQKTGQGGQQQKPPPRSTSGMTRALALKTLGLEEGADEAAIRAAYKHLMAKVHPDMGGTNFFAQQLNEARDYLLGK